MSAGVECTKTLSEFAQLLDLTVPARWDNRYYHVHDTSKGVLTYNPYLDMAYPAGHAGDAPSVAKMTQRYHLFNKVFRNTIAIKQGDKGFVRGWLVNSLYFLERGKQFDLMDYIYEEIRGSVYDRKCCILAPYLQILIEHCIGTQANSYQKIEHKVVSYPVPRVEPTPGSRAASKDDGWMTKLKKVFCLHLDTQKQNYKLHRSNKIIRQNQVLLMRKQGMTVASGSEKDITEEKDWISKHSTWEDGDASSSFVPRGDEDPEDES
jgi:hypothetical protein